MFRVVRGCPDADEVAAVTAVLTAVAGRRPRSACRPVTPRAGWARGRLGAHRAAGSWRS
ncbi:acyl-CoA carboxylase subunit epsilon [Streptomyces boninensis]|uniref:acyl-CoA carboxylase subunit epsilon n=1 Tax=Streptomyces boninensis TaxID=2039455 RepID=UPI003B2172DB